MIGKVWGAVQIVFWSIVAVVVGAVIAVLSVTERIG